jgi:hypothetical protein
MTNVGFGVIPRALSIARRRKLDSRPRPRIIAASSFRDRQEFPMRIEPLILESENDSGLDFGDYFADAALVSAALTKLAGRLDPIIYGYCLEFHCVQGGRSWFKPYGLNDGLNGLSTEQGAPIPSQIFYDRIVIPKRSDDEQDRWPILAKWELNGDDARHMPAAFRNAGFHVQMRVQCDERFMGYFKFAMPGSCSPQDEFRIRTAFESVKDWLREVVAHRRNVQLWLNVDFKRAILNLQMDIARQLVLSSSRRRALRLMCTLMTSHLALGFNRLVFLSRQQTAGLHCIYAHGGDCSDAFSDDVQRRIAEDVRAIDELKDWVDAANGPGDDPLYVELAGTVGDVLRIPDCDRSSSLVAKVWRGDGRLADLGDAAIWYPSGAQMDLPPGIVPCEPSLALGAEIDRTDELLAGWVSAHPKSAWMASRNDRFFVVPWDGPHGLLGIFVLDLGYWSRESIDPIRDVIPRLLFVRAILSEFSAVFAGAGSL